LISNFFRFPGELQNFDARRITRLATVARKEMIGRREFAGGVVSNQTSLQLSPRNENLR